MAMDSVLIVVSTLPDREHALELAQALVERRLAACVNVLSECTSVYRWKGTLETDNEVPVLIKTRDDLYPQVEAAIRASHPYELPEIIAFKPAGGLPAYFEWVLQETAAG
jgi:periplasmic divalent cation tolerance protein